MDLSMQELNMLDYYKMVKRYNVNIIYSGPIWADGIEGIAGTVKKRLQFDELSLTTSKSVYSVFVEQMNNMLSYSAEKEQFKAADEGFADASVGVFILGAKDKTYFLKTGNIMKNESVELIKGRIDHLNSLDSAGLKKYYKDQIRSEDTNPESKGAGVGLIEIARRASSKIEYDFTPFENGLTFFSMSVTIGGGN